MEMTTYLSHGFVLDGTILQPWDGSYTSGTNGPLLSTDGRGTCGSSGLEGIVADIGRTNML